MNQDIKRLRELAKQAIAVSGDDTQVKKRRAWKELHDLNLSRPLVHIRMYMCFEKEIWPLECEDPVYRECELKLKHKIFHHKMADDTVIEPWVSLDGVHMRDFDYRWGPKSELGHATDGGYRPYRPALVELEDFEKLVIPKHEIDEAKTSEKHSRALDAIGDIMPVDISRAPVFKDMTGNISKDLGQLIGLEQLMWYVYDRPEWLHKLLAFMRDGIVKTHDEAEAAGQWSASDSGNQSVPYASSLIDPLPGTPAHQKGLWGFFAAQEFTSLSPEHHDEFILEYQMPIMEKYGLVAYGCCEDLTTKIDMLRKVKNLKRIAVAPAADVKACAEQIQSDYVISWRPNPALMICNGFDEKVVKDHLVENMKILKENNCIYEISLKDIATVKNQPENLIKWCAVAREAIEEVY